MRRRTRQVARQFQRAYRQLPEPIRAAITTKITAAVMVVLLGTQAAEATAIDIPFMPDLIGTVQEQIVGTPPPAEPAITSVTAQLREPRTTIAQDISGEHLVSIILDGGRLQAQTSTVGFVSVLVGDRNDTYETFTTRLTVENVVAPHMAFFETQCGTYIIDGNRIEAGVQQGDAPGIPPIVVVPPPSSDNGTVYTGIRTDEFQIEPKTAAAWIGEIIIRDVTMDGDFEIHKLRAGECVVTGSVFGDGDTLSGLVVNSTNMFGPTFIPALYVVVGNTDEPINVRSE